MVANKPVYFVGGSELEAAGTTRAASWDRGKSLELIRFYDPGYETDDVREDEDEDEMMASFRRRRLKLAGLIGSTRAQMALVAQASVV